MVASVGISTKGVPDMVVGSQCQNSRWARHGSSHGSRVSISTIGVPGMVVGSQCHYKRCTRHGRRKSVSVQKVGKTWKRRVSDSTAGRGTW